ncbi:MAG: hypothetical protein HYT71_03020 [Candidatus Aenigmarchaeota archaeon]|nr:hypothetical protein [Candidatus Aenigmarchaeota archaeon]
MPAVFLPTYSASFAPSKKINSDAGFSEYWEEMQERIGKVFNLAPKNKPVAQERLGVYTFSGTTPKRDIYTAGMFFLNEKPPVNGLWVAQYDVAVGSFDEDHIRWVGQELGLPMKNARKVGSSEILFPVLIGCELAIAYDSHIGKGLEAELLSAVVA